MAGLGGSLGYFLGALNWEGTFIGNYHILINSVRIAISHPQLAHEVRGYGRPFHRANVTPLHDLYARRSSFMAFFAMRKLNELFSCLDLKVIYLVVKSELYLH